MSVTRSTRRFPSLSVERTSSPLAVTRPWSSTCSMWVLIRPSESVVVVFFVKPAPTSSGVTVSVMTTSPSASVAPALLAERPAPRLEPGHHVHGLRPGEALQVAGHPQRLAGHGRRAGAALVGKGLQHR